MKLNFKTKRQDGLHPGLYMQIIPASLENNPNYQNSIVFGETAFSLIERLFLEGEDPWAHWRNIYLDEYKVKIIIQKLEKFRDDLSAKDVVTDQDIRLTFEQETRHFIKHFTKYKTKALNMIDETLTFLNQILDDDIAGITVIGV